MVVQSLDLFWSEFGLTYGFLVRCFFHSVDTPDYFHQFCGVVLYSIP